MLDYTALVAVHAVIQEGSFEAAARFLGITPSAISQRVRGYEERLGALLIIRGQPCMPTDIGRALCAHVEKVQLLEAEIAELSGSKEALPVHLKIAVNADSLATWFPDAVADFIKQEKVFLNLFVEDETVTADKLRSGEAMAAITAQTAPITGCRTIHLGKMVYIACATPSFIKSYFPEGFNKQAFTQAPCICFEKQDGLQSQWLQQNYAMPLPPKIHYIPSTQGFLNFLLAGAGWGMQPFPLVKVDIEKGRLIELQPKRAVEVDLYWVVPRLKSDLFEKLTHYLKVFWSNKENPTRDKLLKI